MSRILPICKPSIISYLHHADPLSIVELDGEAKHYLANNFLQLYSRTNHAPGLPPQPIVDFYSYDGMYPRYPLISTAWLAAKTLNLFEADLLGQICRFLDGGHYVEATLDEYYLSMKRGFQKLHMPHQNLIYGYSLTERVFYVQSFDDNWNFSRFSLPFAEFVNAFSDDFGVLLITRGGSDDYSNSKRFYPALIKKYLLDFIGARCSFMSFNPPGSIFGMATYAFAVEMVAEKNGGQMDIRPWCVFCEHKNQLLSLYHYLLDEKAVAPKQELLEKIKILAADFLAIRNYLLEAILTEQDVKITALKNNIRLVTESEPDIMGSLIESLEELSPSSNGILTNGEVGYDLHAVVMPMEHP